MSEEQEVFASNGHCLGDQWVNLKGLQGDTRTAILQFIYLDELADMLNHQINDSKTKSAISGVSP